jgi:hypothetical protein
MEKSPHAFAAQIRDDRMMTHISQSTLMRRITVSNVSNSD